jgi:hypothetical protein
LPSSVKYAAGLVLSIRTILMLYVGIKVLSSLVVLELRRLQVAWLATIKLQFYAYRLRLGFGHSSRQRNSREMHLNVFPIVAENR